MNSRNTIQRDLVRQAVTELPHPTAEDVYASIVAIHPSVSKATVYRNLGVLVDQGEINRFSTGESFVRYDFNTTAHYHTCCRKCGGVEDIVPPQEHDFSQMEALVSESGFLIEKSELVFYGVCKECRG